MKIEVHIDWLVLEGLPVKKHDSPAIQEAIESELTRLLLEGRLSSNLATGGTFTNVPVESMEIAKNSPPKIGKEIARAVYRGIGE
jgi:hypothetical protein